MGNDPKANTSTASAVVNEQIDHYKWKVTEKITKLRGKHEKMNESLKAIRSHSERLVTGQKVTHTNKAKLVALYETALKQCQCESDAIRKILSDIQQIRGAEFELVLNSKMSRGQMINLLSEQANTLPLNVGGIEGHPQPGVGAIPYPEKSEIPIGAVVAAFVDDVWILAMIANQTSQGKYSIRDIDDEHSRRIDIVRKRLIPLPTHRADPQRDGHALFPVNAIVLALYPQTTCFYKGFVVRTPQTPNDDYYVAFEDSTFDTGFSPSFVVAQRYVITYKHMKLAKDSKPSE
ncbi:Protein of unknown function DUF1325 domain containing protein [Aphelenchoides bicaudatus]|nr:Protein of unknown function DUF1325 domain containing protein [Aphelenchoides bicaudatus]